MPPLKFYIFVVNDDRRVAVVEELDSKVERYWMLCEGMRMDDLFPPTVEIKLARDGGEFITDFIDNIHKAVIISEKARKIMEAEGVTEQVVEYLPFVLRDKKRHKVKEQYYVANALLNIPCLDKKRSEFEYSPTKPDRIVGTSVKRILLLEDQIPPDAKFFRPAELPSRIVIRSDLVERLKAEGCTGISILETGERLP